jgi:hypothetical protein
MRLSPKTPECLHDASALLTPSVPPPRLGGRLDARMSDRTFPDRGNLVARKLKSYAFAQSHGVRIPTIYGLWDKPEDID